MPKGVRRYHCVICGGHTLEVGSLSKRGKCGACASGRIAENYIALKLRTGPAFTHWRQSMAACVGGSLLDEREREE